MSAEPEPEIVAAPHWHKGDARSSEFRLRTERYYATACAVAAKGSAIRIRVDDPREREAIVDAVRRMARFAGRKARTQSHGPQITIWIDSDGAA